MKMKMIAMKVCLLIGFLFYFVFIRVIFSDVDDDYDDFEDNNMNSSSSIHPQLPVEEIDMNLATEIGNWKRKFYSGA